MKLKSQAAPYLLLPLLLSMSVSSYALPLNLTLPAGTALPTTVANGGLDFAYYTVQNNTPDVRSGNFVKWLPTHVIQNTSSGSNCGATFTLQPKGTAGDSCTLKLNITGSTAPDGSQPSDHQKLLVCFVGGKTCTGPGPSLALNVSQGAASPIAVVAGHYQTTTGAHNTFDLAEASQDGGATWTSRITSSNIGSGLPSDFSLVTADNGTGNYFYQPRCVGNNCVIVGSYEKASGYFPTISKSTNGGVNWTSVVSSSNIGSGLPSDTVAGLPANAAFINTYVSAGCNGTICAAAGVYANAGNLNNGIGFLSVSQDSGANWVSKVDATTVGSSLPSDFDKTNVSAFNDVSCQNSYCAAAGYYFSTAAGAPAFPLITVSQNNGTTWTSNVSSFTPASLPPDFSGPSQGAFLFKIGCSGAICASVGAYSTTAAGNPGYHLLLLSQNSGVNWISAIDSRSVGTALPADYTTSGANLFFSVGCSGSNCIAGGRYFSSTRNTWLPFLTSSQNSGSTWTSRIDSTSIGGALPSNIQCASRFSALLGSSCSGNLCVTVGHYQDTSNNRFPILLVSHDGGVTWTRKIDASSVGTLLPNMTLQSTGAFPFADNTLYGVSCNDNFCFAAGSYESVGGTLTPLLLVSQNSGASWTVAVSGDTTISLPSDFFNGTFGAGAAFGFGIQGGGTSLTDTSLTPRLKDKTNLRYSANTVLASLMQG